MEDFHHLVALHNLLEAVETWIDNPEVDQERFVREINLDQLHVAILG